MSERERKDRKLAEKHSASKEKSDEKRKARELQFVYHPNNILEGSGDNGDGGGKGGKGTPAGVGETKKRANENSQANDVERLVGKFRNKKRQRNADDETRRSSSSMIVGLDDMKPEKKSSKKKREMSMKD